MRALTEVQTDSVGGGLQFVGYTGQSMMTREWIASAGGGRITSGSYFSSGASSSGSSSSSGGYGSNLVNPAACKIEVDNAAGIGTILGALLGGAIGARGGLPGAAAGAALVGGVGHTLGEFYGLKNSPNCQPKK